MRLSMKHTSKSHEDLSLGPQKPYKEQSTSAHTCNPNLRATSKATVVDGKVLWLEITLTYVIRYREIELMPN